MVVAAAVAVGIENPAEQHGDQDENYESNG